MTVKLLRDMAKELAGSFYEENERTPGFRQAFPTVKAYLLGRWHQPDGRIKQDKPGWIHHVVLARKLLALMLGQPSVTEHMKNEIYQALMEDRDQSTRKGAQNITQRMN